MLVAIDEYNFLFSDSPWKYELKTVPVGNLTLVRALRDLSLDGTQLQASPTGPRLLPKRGLVIAAESNAHPSSLKLDYFAGAGRALGLGREGGPQGCPQGCARVPVHNLSPKEFDGAFDFLNASGVFSDAQGFTKEALKMKSQWNFKALMHRAFTF